MNCNIYKLDDNLLEGKIHNVLTYHTGDIEGHFTIHFTKDGELVGVYKHGDYAKTAVFSTFEKVEFDGYIELSKKAKEFFEQQVSKTLPRLQYYGDFPKRMGTLWVFDKK